MKFKMTLLLCAAVVIAVGGAAFALNSGHQGHHRWFGQDANNVNPGHHRWQDANQPADANHTGMRGKMMQKMIEKREQHLEKMIAELTQIRDLAQSENATKTVTALDTIIERMQANEAKMKNFASDANSPGGGHRLFHRHFRKGQPAEPNQA